MEVGEIRGKMVRDQARGRLIPAPGLAHTYYVPMAYSGSDKATPSPS